MMVYCVMCVDAETTCVHIFSAKALAVAFADADGDDRLHIIYDYEVDNPARMEQPPSDPLWDVRGSC